MIGRAPPYYYLKGNPLMKTQKHPIAIVFPVIAVLILAKLPVAVSHASENCSSVSNSDYTKLTAYCGQTVLGQQEERVIVPIPSEIRKTLPSWMKGKWRDLNRSEDNFNNIQVRSTGVINTSGSFFNVIGIWNNVAALRKRIPFQNSRPTGDFFYEMAFNPNIEGAEHIDITRGHAYVNDIGEASGEFSYEEYATNEFGSVRAPQRKYRKYVDKKGLRREAPKKYDPAAAVRFHDSRRDNRYHYANWDQNHELYVHMQSSAQGQKRVDDFLSYGYWVHKHRTDASDNFDYNVGAFVDGPKVKFTDTASLTHSAIYQGKAEGIMAWDKTQVTRHRYFYSVNRRAINSYIPSSEEIYGDINLSADFSNNTIDGAVAVYATDSDRADPRSQNRTAMVVRLEEAAIKDGYFSGTADVTAKIYDANSSSSHNETMSGRWGGQFYGTNAEIVAGTIGASNDGSFMVMYYHAEEKQDPNN